MRPAGVRPAPRVGGKPQIEKLACMRLGLDLPCDLIVARIVYDEVDTVAHVKANEIGLPAHQLRIVECNGDQDAPIPDSTRHRSWISD
jgi:hypothetical protein